MSHPLQNSFEAIAINQRQKIIELEERIKELTEALKECNRVLGVYVNGNNPNSLYKDGQHNCYVMGAKEALKSAKQAISKLEEKESETN